MIADLETAAHLVLNTDDIRKLFKRKMKEAKAAKKKGKSRSQLGFVRIIMQNVSLAWQIEIGTEIAVVTSQAKISLTEKDA